MHRVLNHRAEGRWLSAMQVRDSRKEVGGGQDCRIWTKFMCYSGSPHQSQSHILMYSNWIRHIQVKFRDLPPYLTCVSAGADGGAVWRQDDRPGASRHLLREPGLERQAQHSFSPSGLIIRLNRTSVPDSDPMPTVYLSGHCGSRSEPNPGKV